MSLLHTYDVIVWDWNGTLLDDHQVCTDNFNRCISRQNIAPISADEFRRIYRHPIVDMYHDVGFKFDTEYSFEALSLDWYVFYEETIHKASLFPHVLPLLRSLHEAGKTQLICSLLEGKYLVEQFKKHQISTYFAEVSGHHNLEADTKVGRGISLIKPYIDVGKSVVMIGDSSHDAEVARAAGCDCILIGSGHESVERLLQNPDAIFFPSLDGLIYSAKE